MTKKEWVQKLCVGDLVEDCKRKHSKIKEIVGQGYDNPYEVQVTFADGAHCSAMNCLEPVDGVIFDEQGEYKDG